MKKSRYSPRSHPASFLFYLENVAIDDEPLDLAHSHISNRGSTEDLYEFLQRDLIMSSSPSSSSRYSYSSASTTSKRKSSSSASLSSISSTKERRRSLAISLEDAVTINALNGLQKQIRHLFSVDDCKRWSPPDFVSEIDLNGDNHSFLSPKLFHSKKLLNSNSNKHRNIKIERKKGPQDIGRIKGFKSPNYDINCNNVDEKRIFLDEYRSWYPCNSKRIKRKQCKKRGKMKRKNDKNKRKKREHNHHSHHSHHTHHTHHSHTRWNSSTSNQINLKRKISTNSLHSLPSCNSNSCAQYTLDADYNYYIDEDEDEDEGIVFIDYNKASNTASTSSNTNKKYHRWSDIDFLEEKPSTFCIKRRKKANSNSILNKKRSKTYDIDNVCNLKMRNSNSAKLSKRKKAKKQKAKPTKSKSRKSIQTQEIASYSLRLSEDEQIKALMEDIDEIDIDHYNREKKHKQKNKKHRKSKNKHEKSKNKRRKRIPIAIPMHIDIDIDGYPYSKRALAHKMFTPPIMNGDDDDDDVLMIYNKATPFRSIYSPKAYKERQIKRSKQRASNQNIHC